MWPRVLSLLKDGNPLKHMVTTSRSISLTTLSHPRWVLDGESSLSYLSESVERDLPTSCPTLMHPRQPRKCAGEWWGRVWDLRMWREGSSAVLMLGIWVRSWDGSAADLQKVSAGMWTVWRKGCNCSHKSNVDRGKTVRPFGVILYRRGGKMQLWCHSWAGWILAEVGHQRVQDKFPCPKKLLLWPSLSAWQDSQFAREVRSLVLGDHCEQAQFIFSTLILLFVNLSSGSAT